MWKQLRRAAFVAACLIGLPGCVELTQTITLNPDGKGKAKYELVMVDMGGLAGGIAGGFGEKEPKEKTPAEMLQAFVEKELTSGKGVTAWKDVTAKWTKDGRISFTGTAYFEKLEDISATPQPGKGEPGAGGPGPAMTGPTWGVFRVVVDKGSLKIISKNDAQANLNPIGGKPNPMPGSFDPEKATPQEWDDFVLKGRIAYQQMKPFLTLMFSDLKVKTTFQVPGDVKESQGFKKDAGGTLTHMLDGQAVLNGFKNLLTQDAASWKKLMQAVDGKKPVDPETALKALGFSPDMMEPSMTVTNLGKELFDYQREVQEARAAYPKLREQLKLSPNAKLPGEN